MYKNVGSTRLAASGRQRLAVNGGRRFKWLRPPHRWSRHRLQGRMLSSAKLPRSQCIRLRVALVASAILLLCQCIRDPVSSDLEELTATSEPVTSNSLSAATAMAPVTLALAPPFSPLVGPWNSTFLVVACVRRPGRVSALPLWCTESPSGQRTKRLDRLERLGSGQCGRRRGAALRQVIYRPRNRVNRLKIVKRRSRYIAVLIPHRKRCH